MIDQKDTAATMWQDEHSGKRGHHLMTQKLADTIPALGANENARDYDEVLAPAKLFSPYNGWTWYITEMDPVAGQYFGLVNGFEQELGYFDLTELAETTVFGGVPAVERDLYWEPRTLGEIKNGSRRDSPDNQATDGADAMSDETGTETQPSDVLNVEEFLFGHATGDAAGDVGGEPPAGDATDEAGDTEAAAEPDAGTEATAQEPCDADADADADAGEQPAPSEGETTDELKVVLSIRAGRATIGVQRPSADPHIESFDGPDLFGLADQFPAVVARARAIWEKEPRYPAYEKPAPPPRQRTRRQQEAAAETGTGEGVAEQPPRDAAAVLGRA